MISSETIKYSNCTKFPKIYKNTYWGTFKFEKDNMYCDKSFQEICSNRNRFVEEYNIIKQDSRVAYKVQKKITDELYPWCRHIEFYKTNDKKRFVVFSKYIVNDDEHNAYLNKGYVHIYPIYAMNQSTYIKFC